MKKKEYLEKRNALLSAAESLLGEGKTTDANVKMEEIKTLDDSFQEIAKAQANINALKDTVYKGGIDGNHIAAPGQELEDKYNSVEYRKAFMSFVTKGTPIPSEFRNSDESTATTDVASVIPEVVVNRVIETMEKIGMILPLVNKTAFAAGVKIPTSAVKPVATWVNEGASSDRQKKTTSYISFTHYKLRCEISMSMETSVMALSAFEASFVRQVSEAMVKALETKIISTADGSTSMKGILGETPTTGQALTATKQTYDGLIAAEAALPEEYEGNAAYCMTKKTFMGYVGMTDANGQPIARVNYGIGGKPERTLLGRPVVLAGSYMSSFSSTLAAGTIFAFIFNFSDYTVNTVYDMGIQRKQDWDTEDMLTKAVMAADGKVTDKGSLVTIAKE